MKKSVLLAAVAVLLCSFTLSGQRPLPSPSNAGTGGGGSGGGHTIQDEGTPLTQRTNLNCVGGGITCTDDLGNDATVVTVNAGAVGADAVGTTELDDDANIPTAGDFVVVETGALSFDYVTPAAGISTFLTTPTSANLISAVPDETGTGALVFGTSPTLVTPALGTPSALVLTNATGLPLTTGVTGVLPVANFATGTPDGTKFVRDDGVLAVPPGVGTQANPLTFLTATGTTLIATDDGSGTHNAEELGGYGCGQRPVDATLYTTGTPLTQVIPATVTIATTTPWTITITVSSADDYTLLVDCGAGPQGIAAPTVVGFQIDPTGTAVTTGDERMCFPIPAALNGLNLTTAYVDTAVDDDTGLSVMVSRKRRSSPTVWGTVDMLSVAITTDAGELSSLTAATSLTVNTANDDVATGDRVCVDVDAADGTSEGLWFSATFAAP